MYYKVERRERCKELLILGFGFALVSYSVAIGIYECYMGGVAAKLVADYYDYSAPINGSSVSVAIDALPREIYKNTKETAYLMLLCGAGGILTAIAGLVWSAFTKSKSNFAISGAAANLAVILIPFCYSAFLTWKLHSLSSKDKDVWNSIDEEFIDNLWRAQNLMIGTCVPGVFWVIVACVMWCVSLKDD